MIKEFKGHKLANSLSMFLYYKKVAGKAMEKDLMLLNKQQEILNNKESTEDDKMKAYDLVCVPEILLNTYYAMRCSAECGLLPYDDTISEIDLDDVTSGEFIDCIQALTGESKKKVGLK